MRCPIVAYNPRVLGVEESEIRWYWAQRSVIDQSPHGILHCYKFAAKPSLRWGGFCPFPNLVLLQVRIKVPKLDCTDILYHFKTVSVQIILFKKKFTLVVLELKNKTKKYFFIIRDPWKILQIHQQFLGSFCLILNTGNYTKNKK